MNKLKNVVIKYSSLYLSRRCNSLETIATVVDTLTTLIYRLVFRLFTEEDIKIPNRKIYLPTLLKSASTIYGINYFGRIHLE